MTTSNVQAPSHEVTTEFESTLLPFFGPTRSYHSLLVFLSKLTTVCTNILTLEANMKTKRLTSYNQGRDRIANLFRESDASAIYLTVMK